MQNKIEISEELKQELLIFSDLITASSRLYSAEDIAKVYSLHNRILGSNKKPNGCPSCLRSTLRDLIKVLNTL